MSIMHYTRLCASSIVSCRQTATVSAVRWTTVYTVRLWSQLYPNKLKDERISHDRKLTCLWRPILSISDSTHPMLPSPPHTNILNKSKRWNNLNLQREMCMFKDVYTKATFTAVTIVMKVFFYPICGPPFMRSNTWAGLRSCLNLRNIFTP